MAGYAGHAGGAGQGGPNMTPMVDVVMCILIFFMLGSTLAVERYLTSTTPALSAHAETPGPIPPVRLQIKMTRRGDDTWVSALGGELVKMNKIGDRDQSQNQRMAAIFSEKARTLSPDVQIIIQPEQGVPYQDVISVYDCCIKAQLRQVAFAAAG